MHSNYLYLSYKWYPVPMNSSPGMHIHALVVVESDCTVFTVQFTGDVLTAIFHTTTEHYLRFSCIHLQTFCFRPWFPLYYLISHVDFTHTLPSSSCTAYSNSRSKPAHSSLEIISITVTNSRGLKTDPWCNPTFTLNALLSPSVVLTTVCAPSYIAMAALTNLSCTTAFLRAHLVTSLGTLSNAFFQIYKRKVELLSFATIFILHLPYCEDCICSSFP